MVDDKGTADKRLSTSYMLQLEKLGCRQSQQEHGQGEFANLRATD